MQKTVRVEYYSIGKLISASQMAKTALAAIATARSGDRFLDDIIEELNIPIERLTGKKSGLGLKDEILKTVKTTF